MGPHSVPAEVLRWDRMGRGAQPVHPHSSHWSPWQPGDPLGARPGPSCPSCILSHLTMEGVRARIPTCLDQRGPWGPEVLWEQDWAHPRLCCTRALSRDVQGAGSAGLVLLTQQACPCVPAQACPAGSRLPAPGLVCPPTLHSLHVGLLVPTLPPGALGPWAAPRDRACSWPDP